jgi:hypothetical protein
VLGAGSDFGHRYGRRHLKQDMPGVYEVSGLELFAVIVVVAFAFRITRRRNAHLSCEQLFDGRADCVVIVEIRRQNTGRNGALSQQLAHGREFRGRPGEDLHRNAVDGDGHDRTGTLARVRGVRTI